MLALVALLVMLLKLGFYQTESGCCHGDVFLLLVIFFLFCFYHIFVFFTFFQVFCCICIKQLHQ